MKKFYIYLTILLTIGVEIYFISQWLSHCTNFQSLFQVNFSELNSKVIGDINSDKGVPIWQVRIFYNKYTEGLFFSLHPFFRFWDITFITDLISFTGLFGIILSVWYFFTNQQKKIWQWSIFILILFMPFAEMFISNKIPFLFRFGLYALVLGLVSIFGIKRFLWSKKYAPIIIFVLSIISIWWISTNNVLFYIYCIQH